MVDVDFSYPDVMSLIAVDTYFTTTFGTYDVVAPEISFEATNLDPDTHSAPVTLIFYAQAW